MGRQNKYRTLLSNTFLISAGTLGSKLLAFLMVRFYTGLLTPADYGTADLLLQTANLLLPLVSLGIPNSVFRFTLEHTTGRRSVFSVGFYTITAGLLLFFPLARILSGLTFLHGYTGPLACFTAASCYHSLCAQFIRAEGKTALFAGQGLLNTALVIGLNLLLLVVLRLGIAGYVLSIALADVLCSIYLIRRERLWSLLVLHPRKDVFRQMLRYSIPLIPTTVFWWMTSVSDRYMVTGLLGSGANGLYAVACKVPTLLTLLSGIFMEAWQFSAISEARGSRRAHIRFYSQIWYAFQTAMFLAGSAVIAFCQLEIRLLATREYYAAWRYVPVLAAAMVFSSFVSFMGSVYLVARKSSLSFWTAMAGAGVNLLLNLLLIPTSLGIQGAAIATLASYLLSFVLRSVSARRLIPFRLFTGRIICSSCLLLIQMVSVVCLLPMWPAIQAICFSLLLVMNIKPLLAAVYRAGHWEKGGGI